MHSTNMTSETTTTATKICPTCGTRLNEDATRCLVCGADLASTDNVNQSTRVVQGSRMPSIKLGLPAAIGLLAIFLGIGAVIVFFALRQAPQANETCIGIALFYNVSVQSIVSLNNLPTACDTLYISQPLLIPQPTPTVTPLPSATYRQGEQTEAACEKVEYIVQ